MEYAEEYTKKEKIIRFTVFIILGFAVIIFNKLWFLPLVTDFAGRPHCYEFLGMNGADYIWHLFFFGFPVSFFIAVIFMLPVGIQGVREGRYPPKSMKVYKVTVVNRGVIAYLRSGIFILAPAITLLLAIWGYHQIDNMPPFGERKLNPQLCQS